MKLFLFFLVLLPVASNAALYKHTDTVYRLGVIESRSDADFIILNGFETAGSCPLSGEGLVVARFHSGDVGARSYSMALGAKLSGKRIRLAVDDTVKNTEGTCFVQSIEIFD